MKKTFRYIFTAMMVALSLGSCSPDALDFSPTSSGSGDRILGSASSAMSALNGIYRSMHTAGWSTTGNTHMAFGVPAHSLALEVMGDDFVMQARGNGWFWADHTYSLKSYYTSSTYRSYDVWFSNYNWINNANCILDYSGTMSGEKADVAYVLGQAHALRAFSYFNLAIWFSRAPILTRAYMNGERGVEVEHWTEKCVPIYKAGTSISTSGQPRATVREVYDFVLEDLGKAVTLLEEGQGSILNTSNKSYLDLYAALMLKSRVCLAVCDFQGAYDCARRIIDEGGYKIGTEPDLMGGMNLLSLPNVIWGADIQNAEQSSAYASFYGHMDNTDGAYAKSAPKLITRTLYDKIGASDIRRAWWDPDNTESPYISRKFTFSNVGSSLGDVPYMRVEEAYFNAAEAAVRLGQEETARELLGDVMALRDPSFNASRYSSDALGQTTCIWKGSLLEMILLQKRIELWGEFGRVWDVRRLGQGITRSVDDGFASACITAMNNKGIDITSPGTWDWVMMIPKKEIDSNPMINDEDQNQ